MVPRYVTDAGLDETMIILTTKFLQHCNAETNFIGKDIKGIIAAAVYMTAKKNGFHISQVRIGEVVGVTDVTIRSRCKELESLVPLSNLKAEGYRGESLGLIMGKNAFG